MTDDNVAEKGIALGPVGSDATVSDEKALARRQKLNQALTMDLIPSGFTDEAMVAEFKKFYAASQLRMDPLVGEVAALKMLLAEEMAKPGPFRAMKDGAPSELAVFDLILSSISEALDGESEALDGEDEEGDMAFANAAAELGDAERQALAGVLAQRLARDFLRFTESTVMQYASKEKLGVFRDDEKIVKISRALGDIEKARQLMKNQSEKDQVQMKLGVVLQSLSRVLIREIKDPEVLTAVGNGFREVLREEGVEAVLWGGRTDS